MKKQIYSLLIVAGLSVLAFVVSCKKKDTTPNPTLSTQIQEHNADANTYKGESDQADNDINNSLTGTSIGGRLAGIQSSPLCGVNIDTTQISSKIVFFNFDGVTPCFSPSRTRGGQIKVQLTTGTSWANVGSVLTLTYTNFKITYLSTGKSIMFNGTKTLTNLNGNNWIGFILSTVSLKYRERALGINVTFNDGNINISTATWNSARTTQWDYLQANNNPLNVPYAYISFTSNGDTSVNSYSNVDSWGIDRFNQSFTLNYSQPWVSNSYCGFWRPSSGLLTLHVGGVDYAITLGVDTNGNPTTLNCGYGFKVTWTTNNASASQVFSY